MLLLGCHEQNDGETQTTFPQKITRFQWIIQILFDFFPLKQKSDKIKQFLSTNTHFLPLLQPSSLLRELIYGNHA